MDQEQLELILNEIRDGHEDQAIVTEKLQAIREGFSTTYSTLTETSQSLTTAQEKYLGALEVNGRLHNQLAFQRPDIDPNTDPEPEEPLSVDELFSK